MLRAYAQVKSNGSGPRASRNATDDDKRYTTWAVEQAKNAGVRNPQGYVQRNIRDNTVHSRKRVMSQVSRGR